MLGDEELSGDDVASTTKQLGRGDGESLEDHGDGQFLSADTAAGESILFDFLRVL